MQKSVDVHVQGHLRVFLATSPLKSKRSFCIIDIMGLSMTMTIFSGFSRLVMYPKYSLRCVYEYVFVQSCSWFEKEAKLPQYYALKPAQHKHLAQLMVHLLGVILDTNHFVYARKKKTRNDQKWVHLVTWCLVF